MIFFFFSTEIVLASTFLLLVILVFFGWGKTYIHPPLSQTKVDVWMFQKKSKNSLPKLLLQHKNNIWKKKILQLENFSNIFSQEKRIFNFSFTLKLRLLYIVEHRYYYIFLVLFEKDFPLVPSPVHWYYTLLPDSGKFCNFVGAASNFRHKKRKSGRFFQGWEFAHLFSERIARFFAKKWANERFFQKREWFAHFWWAT